MNTKVIFHCLGMSQENYVKKFVIPVLILAILFPFIIKLSDGDLRLFPAPQPRNHYVNFLIINTLHDEMYYVMC